jgi:glycosyltransferase involved in cell wall biosynthesis
MTGSSRTPLVSVLVRTYQSAATLPQAIASILAQTVTDFECLLVDDGSTDGTGELVERIRDPRLRYLRLPVNLGRAAARKVGLAAARGQFLGILDADDWWYPQKLERQLNVLEREPELALLATGLVLTDEGGEVLAMERAGSGPPELRRFPPLGQPRRVPVPHGSSLIRMNGVRQVKIDLGLPRSEDFYFMLQLLLTRPCGLWTEPLYAYRLRPGERHRVHTESNRAARAVYAKYLGTHPLASLRRQAECLLKLGLYELTALIGADQRPLRQRGRPPSASELGSYRDAAALVARRRAELEASASAFRP